MVWWVILLIVLGSIVFIIAVACAIVFGMMLLSIADGFGEAFGYPTRKRRR